jgi:fatty acid desaturase
MSAVNAPVAEKPDFAPPKNFSLAQSRKIVEDLFEPNPVIYWADFLLTVAVGNVCFALVRLIGISDQPWSLKLALLALPFLVCCLAYYRAAMFIHELVHLRTGTFRGFRLAWNLLCGIPFLIPSFVYYPHLDHHRRKHYGTERDGEYLPLSHRRPWWIVVYLSQALWVPVLAFLRFGVVTPVTWLCPPLRRWIHKRASSMVMDPFYIRPLPTAKVRWIIYTQEALCFGWIVLIFASAWIFHQRLPYPFLIQGYAIGVVTVLLNSIRTLGAHRWTNKGHDEMTFVEQVVDSVNYPRHAWMAELWGPIGTRYHALHHLFPSLPYHAMPEAHRRLMAQLPADSPYRTTEEETLTRAVAALWRRAKLVGKMRSRSRSPSSAAA